MSGFSFGGAGGAPAAAPTSTGFGFGGAGGAPAAAPASTGFSFGGAAAAPASTGFGFGGAGAAPASTGFGFGGAGAAPAAAPASTGFSFGGAGAAPAAASASTGFGFAGAGAAPAQGTSPAAYTLESQYSKLPANVKTEIDKFHKEFKQPSLALLLELGRLSGTDMNKNSFVQQQAEINASIRGVKLNCMKLIDEQEKLMRSANEFLVRVKQSGASMRSFGVVGLCHVQKTSMLASREAELPIQIYQNTLADFEARLVELGSGMAAVETAIQELMQSHSDASVAGAGAGRGINRYRHQPTATKINLSTVMELIRQQAQEYNTLTLTVQTLHNEITQIKQWYLMNITQNQFRSSAGGGAVNTLAGGNMEAMNPFEQADRQEAIEQRKLKQSKRIHTPSYATTAQAQTQPQVPAVGFGFAAAPINTQAPTQPAAAGGFSGLISAAATPQATTSLAGNMSGASSALGGISAPAVSFSGASAAPSTAAPTAAPAASGFGFGAPAQPASLNMGSFGPPAASTNPLGSPTITNNQSSTNLGGKKKKGSKR